MNISRIIHSGDQTITLETDITRILNIIHYNEYIRHLIPEFNVNQEFSENSFYKLILHIGLPSISLENKTMHVNADWENIQVGQFSHFMLYTFKPVQLQAGVYNLHAAALKRDEEALVLLGPSKSGKSTLVNKLIHNNDFVAYGDDSINLDGSTGSLRVISGNTHFSKLLGIDLSKKFQGYIDMSSTTKWTNSSSVLRNVFILQADLLGTNPSSKLKEERGKMELYYEIAKEINASRFNLFNQGLPLPSLSNEHYGRRLIQDIDCSNIKYHILTGDIKQMESYISKVTKIKEN